MNVSNPRLTLDRLACWFVETGEDGEGEGGGKAEEDEADLDQEVASSRFELVTVIALEGEDKRSKCGQVEEGGEDCSDQDNPLLALVDGPIGSGSHQAYNNNNVENVHICIAHSERSYQKCLSQGLERGSKVLPRN